MDSDHNSTEVIISQEIEHIEEILKVFWEKAQSAFELISKLREEKRNLCKKNEDMESELQRLKAELLAKEQEIKKLKMEQSQLLSLTEDNVITTQEKEYLKNRIRDLIAKINSHL